MRLRTFAHTDARTHVIKRTQTHARNVRGTHANMVFACG